MGRARFSTLGTPLALAAWMVAAGCATTTGATNAGAKGAPAPAASSASASPAAPAAGASASMPPAAVPASTRAAEPGSEAAADAAYRSTYQRRPSRPVLLRNATLLTATGERLEGASLLLRDGRIAAIGRAGTDLLASLPQDAVRRAAETPEIVDATGKWVTPGLIDPHSHLGVYASPGVDANADGNEMTNPNTANVWAEHSVWPQDPQFPLALAGGVTTMQILPGSANLFGGRSITIKNVPALGVDAMKFPGAPYGLKMACGENPKRVYGDKGRAPMTRMGNVAGYREAWIHASHYRRQWQDYRDAKAKGKDVQPPERDLTLETLAGVLDGSILVQNHCYRADEMLEMIDISHEFGYKVTAFHHAVEAYKIGDVLAREGICADMWADWWGFKMEALDGIQENIALVAKAGACAVVHSDSAEGIQRLNQEAAKAMAAGRRAGIVFTPEDAIRWITINPARSLGIDKQTGSLEVGKMADVVVWSGSPFSVYTHAEKVYIDGALQFDRGDAHHQPETDFELGLRDARDTAKSAAPPALTPLIGGGR